MDQRQPPVVDDALVEEVAAVIWAAAADYAGRYPDEQGFEQVDDARRGVMLLRAAEVLALVLRRLAPAHAGQAPAVEQDEGAGVFYGVIDPTDISGGPFVALSAGLEVHALGARLHCSCGSALPVGPSDLGQHLRCSGCARMWVVRLLLGTVQHAEVDASHGNL